MKRTKSKRKPHNQSPHLKPLATSLSTRFNIKFDLTRNNLSCFIGQKRPYKKTLSKRQPSTKTSKSIKRNKQTNSQINQVFQQKSLQKKIHHQQPDIIKQSLNSILNKIQQNGIKHEWKQTGQNIDGNKEDECINQNSEIWSVFSVNESFQKSYASTIDYQIPTYYHSVDINNSFYQQQHKQRSQSFDGNSFQIRVNQIGYDPRTTIMIRNIPNKYSINDLSQEIDRYFQTYYNFLYLPCDLNNQCNMGYGFINFVDTMCLRDFYLTFHNYKWTKFRSQKICVLSYARLQGLTSLIQHFANSKVLNCKQKKYRPIIKSTPQIEDLIKNQKER